ncbi:MAG: NUDIX domain-containing protein [Candidatus Pacebacteria bacterium]|nr:NUDIX domain-containing protein [Candidatus Paceibacterota bacterium]
MNNIKIINFENVSFAEKETFSIRNSVRAVIFDDENNIGIMKIKGGVFYKVPGGGIEKGESREDALKRECMEEAGVNIEIIAKLGKVIEVKKVHKKVQNSYCYIAKVIGKKGSQSLTESEVRDGYEVE